MVINNLLSSMVNSFIKYYLFCWMHYNNCFCNEPLLAKLTKNKQIENIYIRIHALKSLLYWLSILTHPVTKFLLCMPLCKSGILAEWGNGMNVPYNSQCSIHQNQNRRTWRHNPFFTIKTKVTQVNWKKKWILKGSMSTFVINMIHRNGHT